MDNQFPDQVTIDYPEHGLEPDLAAAATGPAGHHPGSNGVKHGVLKDLFDAQSSAPAASPFTFRVDAYGNPLAPPPGYGAPNGWTVYDSAGVQTLTTVPAGPGYWVKVSAPVTLYNFGIYPPRPGDLPQVYEAGKNWNLLGYTDASGIPTKPIDAYFGENLMNLNPPGPTAILPVYHLLLDPAVLNPGKRLLGRLSERPDDHTLIFWLRTPPGSLQAGRPGWTGRGHPAPACSCRTGCQPVLHFS